jgi:hypothetical protein
LYGTSWRNAIKALLLLDTWAGRREVKVEIIGETKTKYRLRALQDGPIPPDRYILTGQQFQAPKSAILKPLPLLITNNP